MFLAISKIILRNRIALLVAMGLITVFFTFWALRIQLSYDFAKILPASDSYFQEYENFKTQFGEDGSVMVLGIQDSNFFQLNKLCQLIFF